MTSTVVEALALEVGEVIEVENEAGAKRYSEDLFRYNVEVSQEPKGRKLKQIFRLLLVSHFAQKLNSIASDYKSILISRVDLLQKQHERVYDVHYREEYDDHSRQNARVFSVKVTFTGKVSISACLDYLSSTNANAMFHYKPEVLQTLNIVAGYYPKTSEETISLGSNKHFNIDPSSVERFDLGAGLEVLRGFFVSVRAATSRFLINCQVKYAACYQEGKLSTVMAAYRREGPPSVYRLEAFLKRLRVRVTHIRRVNSQGQDITRFKTITGLASPADGKSLAYPPIVPRHGAGPTEVQFWLEGVGPKTIGKAKSKGKRPAKSGPEEYGRYTTVEDFFRERYGLNVDSNVPVVNVGTRQDPSYLPVEVCVVIAGQAAGVKLNRRQTQNMIRFAVRNPAQNARSITTKGAGALGLTPQLNTTLVQFTFPLLLGHVNHSQQRYFGLDSDPTLITVPGRVLQSPSVLYKDRRKVDALAASWNMKSAKFSTSSRLSFWAFIYLVSDRERVYFEKPADLKPCLAALSSKLNDMGVIASPAMDGRRLDVTGAYYDGKYQAAKLDQAITDAITELMSKHKLDLVLAILPAKDTDIYSSVKRVCDLHNGVHKVCVLEEKFFHKNDQYLANVCLKINLKLGGVNQVLGTDELGIISDGKTMIVGIDVTHPSPGSAKHAPSVAGMVASLDKRLGQWPAEIRIQASRQEMVAALDTMLRSRLKHWVAVNGQLPENIIVYRDGVSEGQYNLVVEKEVPLLKSACEPMYRNPPRLSVIIVGKRHHTRIYSTHEDEADRSSNPQNGTVVDRGVTEARDWDFYLQAHSALQGTARPAHYYTVWDEIFSVQKPRPLFENAADLLEHLTHNMCYVFGRATKAVIICPPAYYADLVCERVRCYLKEVFDASAEPSPSGSMLEGGTGRTLETSDVQIHQNVRNTMFYI
ncbi:hypothetical protein AnigIFM59636_008632 [Aspergillus niger]|nr:hypothetical protein AnigIFM59636_008632 [Aspergillus niger]